MPLRLVHGAWRHLRWPRAEWLTGPVDLIHATDLVPPPSRHPVVLTVHDALPLTRPDLFSKRAVRIAESARAAARGVAIVVTTCEATADELANQGWTSRDRIAVAPLGRRPAVAGLLEPAVEPPYVLAVSEITPRKGFDVLASAVAALGPDMPKVVVAGGDGWHAEDTHRRVAALGLGERLRFLGRVDDATLDRLYAHATLFCHPSLAEGFGIPVLEAMGFGVPVIATDIPPLRELGGSSLVFVPPGDAAALAAAIDGLLGDPTRAASMSDAGRHRAERFTWEAMTDRLVTAYREAVG